MAFSMVLCCDDDYPWRAERRFQLAAYIECANVCGHGLCAGASLDDEHAKNHLSHAPRGTLTTSTTWLPAPMRSRRSDMAFWYSMKWANVSSLMRLSRVRI